MTKNYKNNHTQLDGQICIDHWEKENEQGDAVFFTPDATLPGAVASWRHRGTAQLMSDGTFEFVYSNAKRFRPKLIKKLAHGRLSETRDGAILLTLKFADDEPVDIVQAIAEEAASACCALGCR